MYTRFTDVVNSLKSLGKCFLNFELTNKILRSLPKRWDPKVTTIQETKSLNNYPLEELIGLLMTYEMTFLEHNEHDEHMNHLPKNRKDLEFRTMEYHLRESSSDEDDGDENFELLTMNFKKFIKQKLKNKNELERKKRPKKKAPKDESRITEGEMANCALMGFDYKVSNSPEMLLRCFEITCSFHELLDLVSKK
ncbi:unnamed protein product [Musa textilis]